LSSSVKPGAVDPVVGSDMTTPLIIVGLKNGGTKFS